MEEGGAKLMRSEERRRARRVSCRCEARGYGVGEALSAPRLSDISETGAFVETGSELPLRSAVLLRFDAGGRRLRVEAEVVHRDPDRGMGLRFLDLGPRQRDLIARVVTESSRSREAS